MPFVPSSFLFLVVRPGAPSSVFAPSSDARAMPFVPSSVLLPLAFVSWPKKVDAFFQRLNYGMEAESKHLATFALLNHLAVKRNLGELSWSLKLLSC